MMSCVSDLIPDDLSDRELPSPRTLNEEPSNLPEDNLPSLLSSSSLDDVQRNKLLSSQSIGDLPKSAVSPSENYSPNASHLDCLTSSSASKLGLSGHDLASQPHLSATSSKGRVSSDITGNSRKEKLATKSSISSASAGSLSYTNAPISVESLLCNISTDEPSLSSTGDGSEVVASRIAEIHGLYMTHSYSGEGREGSGSAYQAANKYSAPFLRTYSEPRNLLLQPRAVSAEATGSPQDLPNPLAEVMNSPRSPPTTVGGDEDRAERLGAEEANAKLQVPLTGGNQRFCALRSGSNPEIGFNGRVFSYMSTQSLNSLAAQDRRIAVEAATNASVSIASPNHMTQLPRSSLSAAVVATDGYVPLFALHSIQFGSHQSISQQIGKTKKKLTSSHSFGGGQSSALSSLLSSSREKSSTNQPPSSRSPLQGSSPLASRSPLPDHQGNQLQSHSPNSRPVPENTSMKTKSTPPAHPSAKDTSNQTTHTKKGSEANQTELDDASPATAAVGVTRDTTLSLEDEEKGEKEARSYRRTGASISRSRSPSSRPHIDPARVAHLRDVITLTYVSTNDVYMGEVDVRGRPNGEGIYKWADGSEYCGQWKNGEWYGHGVYIGHDGRRYEGGVSSSNQRHGKGIYQRADGTRYEGEFHHDLKHGQGILIKRDGTIYEGNFRYGLKHGKGKTSWRSGATFDGLYADGRRRRGIYTDRSGNRTLEVYNNGHLVQAINLGRKSDLSPIPSNTSRRRRRRSGRSKGILANSALKRSSPIPDKNKGNEHRQLTRISKPHGDTESSDNARTPPTSSNDKKVVSIHS